MYSASVHWGARVGIQTSCCTFWVGGEKKSLAKNKKEKSWAQTQNERKLFVLGLSSGGK